MNWNIKVCFGFDLKYDLSDWCSLNRNLNFEINEFIRQFDSGFDLKVVYINNSTVDIRPTPIAPRGIFAWFNFPYMPVTCKTCKNHEDKISFINRNEIVKEFATPQEKHLFEKNMSCVNYKKGEMICLGASKYLKLNRRISKS